MQEQQSCVMSDAFQLLGKRWTMFVLHRLMEEGPQRFSELENGLPISGRLLSERLKELEAVGLVSRTLYPEVPVRVEYALTDKGKAFQPILIELRKWAETWGGREAGGCPNEPCGEEPECES